MKLSDLLHLATTVSSLSMTVNRLSIADLTDQKIIQPDLEAMIRDANEIIASAKNAMNPEASAPVNLPTQQLAN